MWYAGAFILGFASGGSILGWVFWNKKQKIEEEMKKLINRVGR